MKKFLNLTIFVLVLSFGVTAMSDIMHITIQTTNPDGSIIYGPAPYTFEFNITNSSDCSLIDNSTTKVLTTDNNGIVSAYINISKIDFRYNKFLCLYRDGVLVNSSDITSVPSAIWAKNVSWGGIIGAPPMYNTSDTYNKSEVYNKSENYNKTEVYNKTEIIANLSNLNNTYLNLSGTNANENMNITTYNFSATAGFFMYLGSAIEYITEAYITNIFSSFIQVSNINASAMNTTHLYVGGNEINSTGYVLRTGDNMTGSLTLVNDANITANYINNVSFKNITKSSNTITWEIII